MNAADTGSSLIETVVGISLLGSVLIGVVDASWTSTRVAATARDRSSATAVLEQSLHTLRDTAYVPCPHLDSSYQEALGAEDASRPLAHISDYEYWSRATSSWVDFSHLDLQACSTTDDLTAVHGVQRLTVSVLGPRASIVSGVIVKAHAQGG